MATQTPSQLSPTPHIRRAYYREYYHRTKDRRRLLIQKNSKNTKLRYPEKLKAIWASYYARNKTELHKKKQGLSAKLRRIIEFYKNKPCADCRGWFEYYQMHFDHRVPADKLFTISGAYRSPESVITEIQKCDVVCANCHASRTHKQVLNGVFSKRIKDRMPGNGANY
jgi:5-methylcytosine-specific restriction endonuclease McrA